MMQPLLLLKQTLEAPYDPGQLLLNGPNVKFTSVSQFWPVSSNHTRSGQFVITIGANNGAKFCSCLPKGGAKGKRLKLDHNFYYINNNRFDISGTKGIPKRKMLLDFIGELKPEKRSSI